MRDLDRAGDGVGPAGEQARHLGGRLQVPLGVGFEPQARLVDRAFLADAGQHVLQRAAVRRVIEHIVGRDDRRAEPFAEFVQ